MDRLSTLTSEARDPADLYAVARQVQDIRMAARDLHGRAEELRMDLESFERWVSDPDRRLDSLREDLDAFTQRLERVDATLDNAGPDSGADWARAVLAHHVNGLLPDDLSAEHTDLRQWPGQNGSNGIQHRLSRLRERHNQHQKRLDEAARGRWRQRYNQQLEAASASISTYDPPVEWEAVQKQIEDHASKIE